MKSVFVDTHYLIATINPRDQWRARAIAVRPQVASARLVVTEPIIIETLNYFAAYRSEVKQTALNTVRRVLARSAFEVIAQAQMMLLDGLQFYGARLDKGYSLTDCISMNVMRERGITDVLTTDHHFTQEGFQVLL